MTPLVFLPGAGGDQALWPPVADRLADLGPIHLFGYPGFGGLPADPSIHSLDDLFGWIVEQLPPEASHVIAQSMGGVLAVHLALEHPERVASLVLVATSGGVDVARLGGADWRPEYRILLPDVPHWFEEDGTDFTDRLPDIRARTLLLWGDSDPVSPLSVGRFLAQHIPDAHLVTVAGGTHALAHERPDEVVALIRSHLA
ncbi:MAG: alpha/beta hydrolase [Anaeromyxobacter sp. RBG_16_69_14]|nr:MAG: alpha/beta hydrolase [Anaeromyxobacter sp. RBG_16_69_14]